MAVKSLPLAISVTRLALAPFMRGCHGFRRVPRGACVVAANHSSLVDGVVLATGFAWSCWRPLHMISIAAPFAHPLWGWFLRSARCIPLRKASATGTREMVATALGYLARGEAVGILPEGHVGSRKRLRRLRPGAALLALESGAPLLPVGIRGSHEMLPLGASRPRWGRRIELHAGEPLRLDEEARLYRRSDDVDTRRELVQTVLARLGARLACLAGKEPPRARARRRRRRDGGGSREH